MPSHLSPDCCCSCERPVVTCDWADTYAGRVIYYTIEDATEAWIIQKYWSGGQVVETRTDIVPPNGEGSFVGNKFRTYEIHARNDCGETSSRCWNNCFCGRCYTSEQPDLPRASVGFTYELFGNEDKPLTVVDGYDIYGDKYYTISEWTTGATSYNHSRFIPYDPMSCEFEEQYCLYLGRFSRYFRIQLYKEIGIPYGGSMRFGDYLTPYEEQVEYSYDVWSRPGLLTYIKPKTSTLWQKVDVETWRSAKLQPDLFDTSCMDIDIGGTGEGPTCESNLVNTYHTSFFKNFNAAVYLPFENTRIFSHQVVSPLGGSLTFIGIGLQYKTVVTPAGRTFGGPTIPSGACGIHSYGTYVPGDEWLFEGPSVTFLPNGQGVKTTAHYLD
jgi:hypothetical protein